MFYNYRPDGLSEKGMTEYYQDQFEHHLEEGLGKETNKSLAGMVKNLRCADGYSDLSIQLMFNGWRAAIAFNNGGPETDQGKQALQTLLDERNKTGLAIDAAIRDGVVPEQHPLRSRLEMLANHRKREQELLAALQLAKDMFVANDLILPHTFEVMDEAIASSKAK